MTVRQDKREVPHGGMRIIVWPQPPLTPTVAAQRPVQSAEEDPDACASWMAHVDAGRVEVG